jgi:hypothetical protein
MEISVNRRNWISGAIPHNGNVNASGQGNAGVISVVFPRAGAQIRTVDGVEHYVFYVRTAADAGRNTPASAAAVLLIPRRVYGN